MSTYVQVHRAATMAVEDEVHPQGFTIRRIRIDGDGFASIEIYPARGSELDAEIRANAAAKAEQVAA